MAKNSRPPILRSTQVRVFYRDHWLCHWCHRPTIFAPALKYLERFVDQNDYNHPVAYYHLNYRRDQAPLLDHLAAVIDHVVAYSEGGAHDESNFVVACNKCNMRKSARNSDEFVAQYTEKPVKGSYGEPDNWDGFVALFVILGRQNRSKLTSTEKEWLQEIENYWAADEQEI